MTIVYDEYDDKTELVYYSLNISFVIVVYAYLYSL